VLLNGGSGVQDLGEIGRYPDMNVSQSCSVTSNIFEKEFWFREVEALHVDELRIRVRQLLALAHFEEAIDDEDEFWEIGRKSSAKDIFLTLAMDFITEAPALEHRFRNSARLNCEAPVLRSL
jgi:hypothetical protein